MLQNTTEYVLQHMEKLKSPRGAMAETWSLVQERRERQDQWAERTWEWPGEGGRDSPATQSQALLLERGPQSEQLPEILMLPLQSGKHIKSYRFKWAGKDIFFFYYLVSLVTANFWITGSDEDSLLWKVLLQNLPFN